METRREEAAPTFPTWRRRLEQAKADEIRDEVERFLQVLKAIGSPMIDGSSVHFVYYDPEAQQVAVTGEFNQWDRRGTPLFPLGKTGLFYRTLDFHGPVRVEYKLIVDRQWIVDPLCPNKVDNGIGEQNSVFVVGDLQDPPELEEASNIPHGQVQEFEFESEVLHNRRRVYVYLPPGYTERTGERFATLYVHDGGEYLTRARLPTILDNLIHNQDIPPLIAVMLDPVDRIREYWANEEYACFMETELLPHIDSHYRTLAQREGRGVIGASMGGLISTYLGLSRPQLFSKVGGQSSALFLMDERQGTSIAGDLLKRFSVVRNQGKEPKSLSRLIAELRDPVAFYFDVGKYEPQFIPAHHRLVPLLEAKGCPCFFQELIGGHNWTSWRAHLKDMLTFLWGDSGTVAEKVAVSVSAELPSASREVPPYVHDMNRRFVRFFNGWEMFFGDTVPSQAWSPVVESRKEGETIILRIPLPDVDPNAVGLLLLGSHLILKGKRPNPPTAGNGAFSSLPHGGEWFERIVSVPEGTDAEKITACYYDSSVEITLPAPKGVVARRIPIEVK
ncbi:MAG: alpha/beta hydrolase-fold protein [Candidatus Binatia bacterium]